MENLWGFVVSLIWIGFVRYTFFNHKSNDELIACNDLIKIVKNEILNKDKTIKGFNLGTNIGKVSGQSIQHCHFHLIPRREGDVENPQGGVRSVIPKKQHYKR